jgi:hypothetical protein
MEYNGIILNLSLIFLFSSANKRAAKSSGGSCEEE